MVGMLRRVGRLVVVGRLRLEGKQNLLGTLEGTVKRYSLGKGLCLDKKSGLDSQSEEGNQYIQTEGKVKDFESPCIPKVVGILVDHILAEGSQQMDCSDYTLGHKGQQGYQYHDILNEVLGLC